MEISPYSNTIDVADLKARLEELAERNNLDDEEQDELDALREVADECSGLDAWEYGGYLISDDHFEDFTKDEVEAMGGIDTSCWPGNCLDWDEVVDGLQQDYSTVDYGGETFWIRSY